MVVAQGLGGSIRPYAFQKALYSRHQKGVKDNGDSYYAIKDAPLSWNNKPMGFRFEGDFSNSYTQENAPVTALAYTFGTPSYGKADGNYGYDPTTDRLAGSKHIEYYTNSQLLSANGHPGFVDTDAKGFDRASLVAGRPELAAQIGGFSITNSSGVTYHFALPAYAFNEYSRSESLDDTRTFNELTKNSAYAYTWFLTAITGPDYVDRNAAGLDANDWGYWVKFNYGLWSTHYRWRNPALGYRSDIDAKVRTYSRGQKQVYYLNSISTRTHTALFEKEVRFDGKGTSLKGFMPSDTTSITTSSSNGRAPFYTVTRSTKEYPANSLRLKRVILLKNADVPTSLESASSTYNQSDTSTRTYYYTDPNSHNSTATYQDVIYSQLGENVLDINDLSQLGPDLATKSIRTVEFTHDYSLAPGTANSIDPLNANAIPGKLTLKAVNFRGIAGASMLPPTRFDYEPSLGNKQGIITPIKDAKNVVFKNNIGVFQAVPDANNPNANSYEPGDILRLTVGTNPYPEYDRFYVVLDQIAGSSPAQYHVRCLRSSDATSFGTNAVARVTKNPPYQSDRIDWWGMYKSDFDPTLIGLAEGIARRTSSISNKSTDVWSLRSITSPLGSKVAITYEGDQYSKPVLDRPDMVCRITPATNMASNAYSLHPNQDAYVFDGMTLAQVQALTIPNNNVLLNGLTSTNKQVNGSSVFGFQNGFGIAAKIRSIEAAPGVYGDRAVVWVERTNRNFTIWSQGAFLSLPKMNVLNEGGGLRVKSIAATSGNVVHSTSYNYNKAFSTQGGGFYLPSGVTTYEPGNVVRIDKDAITAGSVNSGYPTADEILSYKQAYSTYIMNIFAIAREIPAPGVMYEAVTVKEAITRVDGTQVEAPGASTYRFKVFKENMIGHTVTPTSNGNNRLYASTVSIKDYTSRIGSLVSMTRYGENGRKLSETVNHFLYDDLDNASYAANSATDGTGYQAKLAPFNYQGVVQESFADSRDCLASDGSYDHKVVMTKRDVYPAIQTSTTTTDYLTGRTNTSETLGFDFYSGTATRTVSADGYGNRFLTEVTPAYQKYPAMGLKLTNGNNRNMLSQVAATTTYKVDASNTTLGVVAASAQTWSDQIPVIGMDASYPENISVQAGSNGAGDVWRPWQTYSWMPTGTTADGLTPAAGSNSFFGFDFTAASQPMPWKVTSQTTLYNPYSNALEAKDINGVYLATKLGFNQSKVLVSGGPAAYQEIAYSGAEEAKNAGDYFSGGVALTWAPDNSLPAGGGPWGSGNVDRNTNPAYVHTGQASVRIGSYKHGLSYSLNASTADPAKFHLDPTKPYRASVWANDAGGLLYYWLDGTYYPGVSGTSQKRTADGWYLLELLIPAVGTNHTTLRIGCYNPNASTDVYFDDLRFQPVNAQVSSYVYDQVTGQVTDILDNNNLYTHYDYTSDGKLKRVSHETFQYGARKVAEHSYHLAGILDAVTLDVTASRVVTVNIPEAADPVSITYDPGDGSYRPYTSSIRPFTFTAVSGANKWVKARIQDGQGNVREIVKHLN